MFIILIFNLILSLSLFSKKFSNLIFFENSYKAFLMSYNKTYQNLYRKYKFIRHIKTLFYNCKSNFNTSYCCLNLSNLPNIKTSYDDINEICNIKLTDYPENFLLK